uniref:Uncharacterized protein n=1 Tax=Oryza brachyantha TaxID=4533 RepID=J3MSF1_ORYBR
MGDINTNILTALGKFRSIDKQQTVAQHPGRSEWIITTQKGIPTQCLNSREQQTMVHHPTKTATRNQRLHRFTMDHQRVLRQAGCRRSKIQSSTTLTV